MQRTLHGVFFIAQFFAAYRREPVFNKQTSFVDNGYKVFEEKKTRDECTTEQPRSQLIETRISTSFEAFASAMVEKENECDFKLQQQMKQAAIARLSELQITVSSAVLHHQNQSPAIQQVSTRRFSSFAVKFNSPRWRRNGVKNGAFWCPSGCFQREFASKSFSWAWTSVFSRKHDMEAIGAYNFQL